MIGRKDTYNEVVPNIKINGAEIDPFHVIVCLHQITSFRPCIFALVIDEPTRH